MSARSFAAAQGLGPTFREESARIARAARLGLTVADLARQAAMFRLATAPIGPRIGPRAAETASDTPPTTRSASA